VRTPPRRIRTKLERRQTAYGIAAQLPSPEIVEVIGYTGYDFAWLDCEHGSFDLSDLRQLIRAADAAGVDALVRPRDDDPGTIGQILDLGAAGVVVPDVRTLRQACEIVAATRYAPAGTRGACPGGRAVGHLTQDWVGDYQRADRDVLCFGIIEHPEGVDHVEDIASQSGLDGLMFGPFDLAMHLGLDGDVRHPDLIAMQQRLVAATRSAGIEYVSPNAGWETDLAATGSRVIPVSGDRVALVKTLLRLKADVTGQPAPTTAIA